MCLNVDTYGIPLHCVDPLGWVVSLRVAYVMQYLARWEVERYTDRRLYQKLVLMYKIKNCMIPHYLLAPFPRTDANTVHYNLRNRNDFKMQNISFSNVEDIIITV